MEQRRKKPEGVSFLSAFRTESFNRADVLLLKRIIERKRQGAAFNSCTSLRNVYFEGNSPIADLPGIFGTNDEVTSYYLPGTTGWGPMFADRPTALWELPNPLIPTSAPNFGVRTNQFGFVISWATNTPVVVEASTTFKNPAWLPLGTNTLSNGSLYFSDPRWTNYPARFYRLRSP